MRGDNTNVDGNVHPKINKLHPSPLEGKNKRKRGDVNMGKAGGKRRGPD